MEMKLNVEKLKKLRESKAWSQSHLSDVSGISLRTIQRIEKSGIASPESTKSICSAYEILVADVIYRDEISIDSKPAFLSKVKSQLKYINKEATILSFLIAFIIAFMWTA